MTVIADAPTYPHGYVVGRYLTAVADTVADSDRLMDFTPAKGRVVFTPERGFRTADGPVPTFVVQRPVECPLDEQGYLTSPGGGRGVGLIVGVYLVRFEVQGAQVPGPTRIEVRGDHTEVAPLDLILAMPEVVPPGTVVVVDETTAQRAEAAAARAEAIVADIEAEVREVVASNPDLRGEAGDDGADGVSIVDVTADDGVATVSLSDGTVRLIDLPPGEDGHTPVPSWEGTALSWDGGPAVDLRGEGGKTPTIKIGTVTSGTTPSASITGTSPDLTLGLVLPKGDPGGKGDPGAPGALANASSYVIVGPGRPDQPATTGGVITGSEPVGAEYRSTDGASVGAWTWRKRPSGWAVTDGDTGWRNITSALTAPYVSGTIYLRRTTHQVHWWIGKLSTSAHGSVFTVPTDFASVTGWPPIFETVHTPLTRAGQGSISPQWIGLEMTTAGTRLVSIGALSSVGGTLQYPTFAGWPSTLPGSPA